MTRRTSVKGMHWHLGVVLALLLVGQMVGPIWGAEGGGQVRAAQGGGGGLIAYVGEDQNIWVMNADGSDPSPVTTNGGSDRPAIRPAWSHDGTMLAFSNHGNGDGSGDGIWVVRDGTLSKIPNTERCTGPAFSADNTRILYGCANAEHQEEQPSDLETNPARGFVSSSALDGSDQRVEIPYRTDGEMPAWDNSTFRGSPTQVDVSPVTGEIVVVASGLHYYGAFRFSPDGELLARIELYGDPAVGLGPWVARFMPDGQSLLVTTCSSGCLPGARNAPNHDVLQLDLEGNEIGTWQWSSPGRSSNGLAVSPDGNQAIVSFSDNGNPGQLFLIDANPDDEAIPIGQGTDPAWQPVDAVFTLPDGSQVGSGASSGSTPGTTGGSSTPVPSAAARTDSATPSSGGLLAYVGTDGNIWTINADGGIPTQITYDGTADDLHGTTYRDPSWSHDGTMLVFSKRDQGTSIVLWRDGSVNVVPGVSGCDYAAFLPGDTHLALACGQGRPGYSATDPTRAMVSTITLDGSDFRTITPFDSEVTADNWTQSWEMTLTTGISVLADGTIVVSGVIDNSSRDLFTQLIHADGSFGPDFGGAGGKQLSAHADASGTALLGTLTQRCRLGEPNTAFVNVNLQGDTEETLATLPPDQVVMGADRSPDGSTIAYGSTTNMAGDFCETSGPYPIRTIDIASGQMSDLGVEGFDVVWQPSPGGDTVPTTGSGTHGSAAPTAPPPSGQGQVQGSTAAVNALPTSGQLVFSAKDGGQWDLYLHDFTSGQNVQLTNEPGDEWAPAFSHDGGRLAYLSDQSGSNQVWIMNPDGSNPIQISFWDGYDQITYVDWSSNNQTLYITMQADTVKYVMQMPVAGGAMTAFLDGSAARPQVTSDGTCFFITDNEGLTRIASTTEANPANYQVLEPGDALLLDPSGTYGVYQIGDPGSTDSRRLGILGIGRPALIVAPGSGYDDSDPVMTGTTNADHILWVVDNGTTISIWSSNVTEDATTLVTGAVDTGHHDSIWYIAWRPGPGTGSRPGA